MLKVVQEHLEEYLSEKQKGHKPRTDFIKDLDSMHMFIASSEVSGEEVDNADFDKIGLPFQSCYFALRDSDTLRGIYVHEKEPNKFEVQLFFHISRGIDVDVETLKKQVRKSKKYKNTSEEELDKVINEFIGHKDEICALLEFDLELTGDDRIYKNKLYIPYWLEEHPEAYNEIKEIFNGSTAVLLMIMYRVNNKQTTLTETDEQVKVRARLSGKFTKLKYKPNYIIHINSEKKVRQEYPNARIVTKPNYSWEVRGFWRQLASRQKIGHDRNGLIIYNGYTWVKPHVRGEGELIKKVRVM